MKFTLMIDTECDEEILARVHAPSQLTEQIENLVLAHAGSDELTVQGDWELLTLKYGDVECITIIDRKLCVIDKKGQKYRKSGALCDVEGHLPSYFIRINKSTFANERRISCFKTTFSGGVDAIFRCGYRDYVSRRCFREIKRRYKV